MRKNSGWRPLLGWAGLATVAVKGLVTPLANMVLSLMGRVSVPYMPSELLFGIVAVTGVAVAARSADKKAQEAAAKKLASDKERAQAIEAAAAQAKIRLDETKADLQVAQRDKTVSETHLDRAKAGHDMAMDLASRERDDMATARAMDQRDFENRQATAGQGDPEMDEINAALAEAAQ